MYFTSVLKYTLTCGLRKKLWLLVLWMIFFNFFFLSDIVDNLVVSILVFFLFLWEVSICLLMLYSIFQFKLSIADALQGVVVKRQCCLCRRAEKLGSECWKVQKIMWPIDFGLLIVNESIWSMMARYDPNSWTKIVGWRLSCWLRKIFEDKIDFCSPMLTF